MILTREQILEVADIKLEKVAVPEWGGHVLVRSLSGEERDRLEEAITVGGKTDISNLRARIVSMAVVDEQGKLVFRQEDIQALAKKSTKALDRVYAVASRLAGLSAKDQEELLKN